MAARTASPGTVYERANTLGGMMLDVEDKNSVVQRAFEDFMAARRAVKTEIAVFVTENWVALMAEGRTPKQLQKIRDDALREAGATFHLDAASMDDLARLAYESISAATTVYAIDDTLPAPSAPPPSAHPAPPAPPAHTAISSHMQATLDLLNDLP